MMKDKDTYLGLELAFTFLLLIVAMSLLGSTVSFVFKRYLISGLVAGLCFSWLTRNRPGYLIKSFVTFGVFASFIWLVYSVLNSSLFYREIILISIKAILLLEIILSFNASYPAFLAYIQALSVLLFMSHPLFIKDYSSSYIILSVAYLIFWLGALYARFYGAFNTAGGMRLKRYNSVLLSLILFAAGIFVSWVLFSGISASHVRKGGFLQEEGAALDTGLDYLEVEYYELQGDIQKKFNRLIPGFQSSEEGYQTLQFLDKLIKKTPGVLEVKQAAQGLVSRLKAPGLGLEKKDEEQSTSLMNRYLDKKTAFHLKEIKDKIRQSLASNHLKTKDIFSILFNISRILYSKSYQQMDKYENEIKININNALPNTEAARELNELTNQLKEWKIFDLYRSKLASLNKKIDSLKEGLRSEFRSLLSEIDNIKEISALKEMEDKLKSLEYATAGSSENIIKDMGEFLVLKAQMLLLEKESVVKEKIEKAGLSLNKVQELKQGLEAAKDTKDNQQSQEIFSKLDEDIKDSGINASQDVEKLKDLQEHLISSQKKEEDLAEKMERKEQLIKEEKARIARERLERLILTASYFAILGVGIALVVLYFLREKKKNELKLLLKINPRKFIIDLYENAKKVLGIFNLNYNESVPPLLFAESVRKKYSLEDDLFLRFTSRFEEAKYSGHTLQSEVAASVLDDYNNFLKTLFSRYGSISLFSKHCLALPMRIPFLISR